MYRFKRIVLFLLLLCLTLTMLATCASRDRRQAAGEKQPEVETVDLFTKDLRLNVEHTYREGDKHILSVLASDGHTGVYAPTQPGELPVLRDVDSGKRT